MALIACENVSFSYEGKAVVEGLNLQVENGDFLCVVGENGSGKSTLVKGLLGLLSPTQGRVLFGEGLQPTDIGYLPQRTDAQRDFPASVWEVAASGCRGIRPWLSQKQKAEVLRVMGLLRMEGLKRRSFSKLSGGQQQRALLARAILSSGRLLLLDEPTAGLDPVMTRELYQIIADLHAAHGMTLLMVTHDMEAALRYGKHILHLSHGFTFYGTAEEYALSPLGRSFGGGGGHV